MKNFKKLVQGFILIAFINGAFSATAQNIVVPPGGHPNVANWNEHSLVHPGIDSAARERAMLNESKHKKLAYYKTTDNTVTTVTTTLYEDSLRIDDSVEKALIATNKTLQDSLEADISAAKNAAPVCHETSPCCWGWLGLLGLLGFIGLKKKKNENT